MRPNKPNYVFFRKRRFVRCRPPRSALRGRVRARRPIVAAAGFRRRLCAAFAALIAARAASAPAPRIVRATYFGGAGDDDLPAAAWAPDGSLYVVGNAERLPAFLEGATAAAASPAVDSAYGHAFVARLAPDADRRLAAMVFPKGRVFLTSIAIGGGGVYVGGYELSDKPGESFGGRMLTRRRGRHGDCGGVPAVWRMDPALTRVLARRRLPGAHFVWSLGANLDEFRWQPTEIAALSNGDIVVSADGGAAPGYYRAPDRLLRLTADLQTARWEIEIGHPRVQPPEKVGRYWSEFDGWSEPFFGQTRILRLRAGARDRIAIGGWSPTRTSREPWWSPFILVFSADGQRLWSAYAADPMSGGGDRLNGDVADSAILSVAPDGADGWFFCGVSDGGNTILRRDPLDFTRAAAALKGQGPIARQGRCLFYGLVGRLEGDSGQLRHGLRLNSMDGARGSQPDWAEDIAALPDGGAVAVGRAGAGFQPSDRGESGTSPRLHPTPQGFLRRFDAEMNELWRTRWPETDPRWIAVRGARVAVVGSAFGSGAPASPNALQPEAAGGEDGWLTILEFDGTGTR